MKKFLSLTLAALFAMSVASTAYAHCGSCGTGDKDHKSCKAKCSAEKDDKAKKACEAKCDHGDKDKK